MAQHSNGRGKPAAARTAPRNGQKSPGGAEAIISVLTAERDALRKEVSAQRRRLRLLEKRQQEAMQRIDSAISSIHEVLES